MRILRNSLIFLLLVFFFLFLIVPLYSVVEEGLRPDYLWEALRNPVYLEGLWNAFLIGLTVTTIVALIAIPLAVMADRYEFAGKSWVNGLILLPLILPPFVGALGFQQVFGQLGAFNALLTHLGFFDAGLGPDWLGSNRFAVVCLIEALHLYPILYLNLSTVLANIDPALHDAARNLGATPWRRFRQITLPLVRPGMFAGGIIVFIWSFTELGTPLMLGYTRVAPVQIFRGVTELGSNPIAYSLVVILLVISAGLYLLSHYLFGESDAGAVSKGSSGDATVKLRGWRSALPGVAFLAVTAVAVLPHLAIILLSASQDWYGTLLPSAFTSGHYSDALGHAFVVPSIINSLKFALTATVLAIGAGFLTALIVVRWKPRGWQAIDVLSMMPLAVPGIILAFGYLSMATRYEWMRQLFDPVENPTFLLIIAYAVRRMPYVVRAGVAGLQQTPIDLEQAAAGLGASPWMVLRRITFPLIVANLIAGGVFAFSFSMLEVSDSLILAQKTAFFPITRAIYELSQILGSGHYIACAFGVWAMVFLAVSLFAVTRILGRKMGALFRF
ncbi:MAG: iron(III) transport system permease protein [Rhodothermales bacterium]